MSKEHPERGKGIGCLLAMETSMPQMAIGSVGECKASDVVVVLLVSGW